MYRPHLPLFPILVLASACAGTQPMANGEQGEYFKPTELVYEDHNYSPTIGLVQFFKKGFELSPPIIDLGVNDPLVLRFDDLQPEPDQLSYTIVHCDAHWAPSDLAQSQYIAGAPTDFIPTPHQSFGTITPFIEYTLELPNEMMRPNVAGNYLVKVYRGTDQNDLVLTRRFLVFEQRMDIQARATIPRDVEVKDIAQQVDLTIAYQGVDVADPFSDLSVTVLQNMRWDDARTGLKPNFLRDHELVYDFPKETQFLGANEWRYYDLKNLRYVTTEVNRIVNAPDGTVEVFLQPDAKRDIKVYLDAPDINGKCLVRNDLVDGDPLGADYTWVNFTLPLDGPLASGDIHVYGGFADFQCRKELRMLWMPDQKAYTLRALIKQGYLNYSYAFLPNGSDKPDLTTVEGSHYQTENDYLILVYVKDYTLRCDRLLGIKFVNSRRG